MKAKSSALALFQNRLKFSDGLEVFRPTGGAFDVNQPLQSKTEAFDAKQLKPDRIAQQVFRCVSTIRARFSGVRR